jgi:hypothetical protein
MNEIVNRMFENPDIFYVLLSVVAIVISAIVVIVIAKFLIIHRERMAMIRQGIHPDYPLVDDQTKRNPP